MYQSQGRCSISLLDRNADTVANLAAQIDNRSAELAVGQIQTNEMPGILDYTEKCGRFPTAGGRPTQLPGQGPHPLSRLQ